MFCIWGFLLELLPNFYVFLYSHTQFSNVTILGMTFQPIVHFVPLLLRNGAHQDAHSSDVVSRKAWKMFTWPLKSLSSLLISEAQLWLSESIWLLAIGGEVCPLWQSWAGFPCQAHLSQWLVYTNASTIHNSSLPCLLTLNRGIVLSLSPPRDAKMQ